MAMRVALFLALQCMISEASVLRGHAEVHDTAAAAVPKKVMMLNQVGFRDFDDDDDSILNDSADKQLENMELDTLLGRSEGESEEDEKTAIEQEISEKDGDEEDDADAEAEVDEAEKELNGAANQEEEEETPRVDSIEALEAGGGKAHEGAHDETPASEESHDHIREEQHSQQEPHDIAATEDRDAADLSAEHEDSAHNMLHEEREQPHDEQLHEGKQSEQDMSADSEGEHLHEDSLGEHEAGLESGFEGTGLLQTQQGQGEDSIKEGLAKIHAVEAALDDDDDEDVDTAIEKLTDIGSQDAAATEAEAGGATDEEQMLDFGEALQDEADSEDTE